MPNFPAIEVADLTKFYRNGWFRRPFQALRGVSLRSRAG